MGILKNFFAIRGRYRKNYDDYDRKGKSSRIATIVAMSIFPVITLLCVYFTCVLFTKGGEENTVYAIMLGILTVGLFVSSLEYSLMHTIIGFRSAVSSKIIDRIEDKVDENKTQTKLEIVDGKIVQKEVNLTETDLSACTCGPFLGLYVLHIFLSSNMFYRLLLIFLLVNYIIKRQNKSTLFNYFKLFV